MSWWHNDIDVWAGTDGTDIYKAYVDIINAVHERYESVGIYAVDDYWNRANGHYLKNLQVNTNRNAYDNPVYGTKDAPLDYEDVLGVPLHGNFYYMALRAFSAVDSLHHNLFSYNHPSRAGWVKSPDWDGEDPDGVWTTDALEAEFGALSDHLPGVFGSSRNAFHLPEAFKYMRRILEVLIYPIIFFDMSTGMEWPEDWVPASFTKILGNPPISTLYPVPIGTIYESRFSQFALTGIPRPTLNHTTPTPYTTYSYQWSGGFTSNDSIEQVVTPEDALSDTYLMGSGRGPEDPIPRWRLYPPTTIRKVVSGPAVAAYEHEIIFIPPEFRGEWPNNNDRGPVVHSITKRCSAGGQQSVKIKMTPVLPYRAGAVLKEFMWFHLSAKDCPVISWVVGAHTVTDRIENFTPDPYGGAGDYINSGYYEISGVLNPVAEELVEVRHAEGINENPFDGVYDQWHVFNPADTVYILRERVTVRGIGSKSISTLGPLGSYSAFALMDMGYTYS